MIPPTWQESVMDEMQPPTKRPQTQYLTQILCIPISIQSIWRLRDSGWVRQRVRCACAQVSSTSMRFLNPHAHPKHRGTTSTCDQQFFEIRGYFLVGFAHGYRVLGLTTIICSHVPISCRGSFGVWDIHLGLSSVKYPTLLVVICCTVEVWRAPPLHHHISAQRQS